MVKTTMVALLGLEITANSSSVMINFNSKLFLEYRTISDEIRVNFTTSVIGSVVELPTNKIKCAKMI